MMCEPSVADSQQPIDSRVIIIWEQIDGASHFVLDLLYSYDILKCRIEQYVNFFSSRPASGCRRVFCLPTEKGYTQCKPRKIVKRLSQPGSPRPWQLKWRKKQQKRCCPLAATSGDFWQQP